MTRHNMMAVKTSLHANQLPDNLHGIRTAIEKAVPHGRTDNSGKNDRGAWSDAPAHHLEVWAKLEQVRLTEATPTLACEDKA